MKSLYILLLLISFNANATTWVETEVDDPIKSGEKCKVDQPASSGSYVYNYPSKYDQVFWPLTDSHGIWHCENSGFIAFIGDFDEITLKEKEAISKYLASNKNKATTKLSKLELLEKMYSLRNKKPEFKNRIKRVFAYLYEEQGKIGLANKYRKEVLVEINAALEAELSEYKKLEYLYIAANYERQFGDISKSDARLAVLKSALENIEDEKVKGFANYLSELIKDTLHIKPAGKLTPKIPENEPEEK